MGWISLSAYWQSVISAFYLSHRHLEAGSPPRGHARHDHDLNLGPASTGCPCLRCSPTAPTARCAPSSSATVRVRDADVVEGVGYTFTVGRNGAIHDIAREVPEILAETRPHRASVAEAPVGAALRRARRPDRAHDVGGRRRALGPEGESAPAPPRRLLGGHDPKVPATPAASTSTCRWTALLRQTDGNLEKGFRAIKMSRPPPPPRGRRARARHARTWATASRSWPTPT